MASLSEKHEALGFQKGIHLGINQGRQEGRQEGREEGKQEGEATLFTRLLQRRFKTVPEPYLHRITKADSQMLFEWSKHILDATTLEEVFSDSAVKHATSEEAICEVS